MTATKHDDLEATKVIVEALDPFENADRERIIRWVCEKLGIVQPPGVQPPSPPAQQGQGQAKDIKTFLSEKAPKSNNQLAAAVAYYHMFEAPVNERKSYVTKEDLQNACRLAGLERLTKPDQTLVNAHNVGILDKGAENGTYKINSVGENLVAMTMPSGNGMSRPKKGGSKKAAKKAAKKNAKKK